MTKINAIFTHPLHQDEENQHQAKERYCIIKKGEQSLQLGWKVQ
jgi:hypothetical protein